MVIWSRDRKKAESSDTIQESEAFDTRSNGFDRKAVFVSGSLLPGMVRATGLKVMCDEHYAPRGLRPSRTVLDSLTRSRSLPLTELRSHLLKKEGVILDISRWPLESVSRWTRRMRDAGYDCWLVSESAGELLRAEFPRTYVIQTGRRVGESAENSAVRVAARKIKGTSVRHYLATTTTR